MGKSVGCHGGRAALGWSLIVKPPKVWEFGAVEQKEQKDLGKQRAKGSGESR